MIVKCKSVQHDHDTQHALDLSISPLFEEIESVCAIAAEVAARKRS